MKKHIKDCLYTMSHPVAGFNDYLETHHFPLPFSMLLFLLFYLAMVLNKAFVGFSFSSGNAKTVDPGMDLIVVCGALFLWTACNWAISTLFDGKGKLKEIWFVTTVATVPYSVALLINTLLSNVLVSNESVFMTVISTIGLVWSIFLLIVGLMLLHDYSLGKVLLSSIASIVAIVIILFLGLLFFSLFQQVSTFFSAIANEISYRT